jgi:hypothetical protein
LDRETPGALEQGAGGFLLDWLAQGDARKTITGMNHTDSSVSPVPFLILTAVKGNGAAL